MSTQCCRTRKGRPPKPIPKALPDNLYDYADEPTPEKRQHRRNPPLHDFDVEKLPVIDDWPERVPVTEAEIEIFERYFGDVLDRLFGGSETDLNSLSHSDNEKR